MKSTFDQTTLDLEPTPGGYTARLGEQTFDVEVLGSERGRLDLLLNGQRLTAYITAEGSKRWVTVQGRTFVLTKPSPARRRGAGPEGASGLTAPMPGQVRALLVKEGDAVTRGATLLVIEAMKMEIRVQAPRDGLVKKLYVKQGDSVEREQRLVELEETP
jgi:biotin carboxyl carrier protein